MEGKHLADGFAHLVVGGEGDALALLHAPALEFEAQLEKEQLLEDEPAMSRGRGALQLRKRRAFKREMHFAQRSFALGEAETVEHRLRQAIGHRSAHGFEQIEDGSALPARGQTAAAQRFIDGCDAAHLEQPGFRVVTRVGQDLELRLDHFEVAAGTRRLDLAVDRNGLPSLELPVQVGRVEPKALHRKPALAESNLVDRSAPRPHQHRPAHLGDHARHFAGHQLVQAAWVLPVFVAKGEVVEQVFSGLDALEGEHLRYPRADAAHKLHWSIQGRHTWMLQPCRGLKRWAVSQSQVWASH